ncbi:MAG: hypothetical protein KatS3mg057_0023 [Herpetosiphonaceae bacterium]|nr:MAG: hypothetical protein KatS3mg057_0023 [Herpetosiphonaceae bacterium]
MIATPQRTMRPLPTRLVRLMLLIMLISLIGGNLALIQTSTRPGADQHSAAGDSNPALQHPLLPPAKAILEQQSVDRRDLPADLAGLPELIEQRTADSATFQTGEGRYTTIVAGRPLHYQDALGRWQVIDPTFLPDDSGFTVQRSDLRSRAGLRSAWLSVAGRSTLLTWQATELGVIDIGGNFQRLANALPESPLFAEQREGGRVLHYSGGWSDPQLAEQIISDPGRLEHLLVLAEAPRARGAPLYLEMRATLRLLPGASLWADGLQRSGSFQTSGSLEIRDSSGAVDLIFDPVLAFEQDRSGASVAGQYSVMPGEDEQSWIIGVRTPWRWWMDPNRRYPAAIDPTITMEVLKTTGYADGLAWVGAGGAGNPDTNDLDFRFDHLVLGSWNWSGSYRGYIQFNSLPFMLTSAPISVTGAFIDIEPSGVRMPSYEHDADDYPDWEMQWVQLNATLSALGQCPDDCNGFSLRSKPTGFDWNSTIGTPISRGTKPLVAPPPATGGNTKVTTWDVTADVQQWNAQSPRPLDGPMFLLQVNTNCQHNSFIDDNSAYVIPCTRFVIPSGGVRMRIEYEAQDLNTGQAILNRPGVPSYLKDVFKKGTTDHQYDLQDGGGTWRAVAARGNHRLQPALPAKVGLKLLDYGDPQDIQPLLTNAGTQSYDETAFALIDGHNSSLSGADLGAAVTASDKNDFSTDEDRNYLIEYQQASAINYMYGVSQTVQINLNSGRLVQLREFSLVEGDNVGIFTTAPPTIELALAAPTAGADKADALLSNAQLDTAFGPDGAAQRSIEVLGAPAGGTWGMAMINQGRPFPDPERPDYPGIYEFEVTLLICPQGAIPTIKWGCQPVRLPYNAPNPPWQPKSALGLNVYSPGGFTSDSDPNNWCTTNEGQGTPIIESAFNGRWIVVGQGSVCWDGTTLRTTADSGVALAYRLPGDPYGSSDPRGKIRPTFVYGTTMLFPPPADSTGVTSMSGSEGQLLPTETTRRNIRPFKKYWDDVFTLNADSIATSTMTAYGSGAVDATVTIDAAVDPSAIVWSPAWTLYPDQNVEKTYVFDIATTQTPLHDSLGFTSIVSLELRALDSNSNTATGLLDEVNYVKNNAGPDAVQFHAVRGKITQPPLLGGATKNVQIVVQPPGMPRLPDNIESCPDYAGTPTSCLDLRLDSYSWDNGNGDKNVQLWELPDAHIVDNLGSLALSTPGKLALFTQEHPNSPAKVSDVEQGFTFDTWGASVSIKEEECYPGSGIVTVIKGTASIALPMLGDDGGGSTPPTEPPSVKMSFTLCQSKFYQASLELNIHPATIPAGSSGLGIYLIAGKVTVNPEFTQIELKLGFQTLDGETISDGLGVVTIDTRGKFSLDAKATIVAVLDAHLLLEIAWSPLDVLLQAEVKAFGGLITGALHMHGWIGQGWQNKYTWLPDNDDFHFTGSIKATLYIPEGYVADLGFMALPPFDFTISLKIAFGEFCTNDSCTTYDWGMSAVLSIAGYDVGLYVDSSGPEFILGTDDHVLIDQFGGGALADIQAPVDILAPPPQTPSQIVTPGQFQPFLNKTFDTPVDDWPVESAADLCDQSNPTIHICPFTVGPGVGRALFSAGWQNGDLQVTLIKPDNTEITPANASSHGVVISSTQTALLTQMIFAVTPVGAESSIMSGQWKLKLSNVEGPELLPGTHNNYRLLFASDPPAPALTWISPVDEVLIPDASGVVTLEWSVMRGSQPVTSDVKLELAYVSIDSKPISETDVFSGTLIASQLDANQGGNQGSYAWDTSSLASGEYAVVARLDDHFHGNGSVVAWASGTVLISDTVAPPVPVILNQIPQKDALVVTWQRDTTPDLAGYLVEYGIPPWHETPSQQIAWVRRVLPRGPSYINWLDIWWEGQERARLGGLLNGQSVTVCVRAYDASGNISDCQSFTFTLPEVTPTRVGAPVRFSAIMSATARTPTLNLLWESPGRNVTGYLIGYHAIGCLLPDIDDVADQGPSTIFIEGGNITSFQLTGLTPGQTYWVAISAVMSDGYVGPPAVETVMFMHPEDSDSDGLPDQWEALYLVSDPAADPDKDGLSNLQEFQRGTFPTKADSDGDGYYDNEENESAMQSCSPDHPAYHSGPKLVLGAKNKLIFSIASNQLKISPQSIKLFNFGGDTLNWSIEGDSWIVPSSSSGAGPAVIDISVDPRGLSPGRYRGMLTITSVPGASDLLNSSTALSETASIEVELEVLPAKLFKMYLPLSSR